MAKSKTSQSPRLLQVSIVTFFGRRHVVSLFLIRGHDMLKSRSGVFVQQKASEALEPAVDHPSTFRGSVPMIYWKPRSGTRLL